MSADWKSKAQARLMQDEMPTVLTTAMLYAIATSGMRTRPSLSTLNRWQKDLVASKMLREVTKGVYLNRLRDRNVSPAAASVWVRSRSIVSLSWVLEQAGVTNNFGDTVTCVIPTHPTWPNPQVGDMKTTAGEFRFFAMPDRLTGENTGRFEDHQDVRFDYQRATPEKAFLDYVYLGASSRSRLSRPPFDLDLSLLNAKKIARLAKGMDIEETLAEWMKSYAQYQGSEDVIENQGVQWWF